MSNATTSSAEPRRLVPPSWRETEFSQRELRGFDPAAAAASLTKRGRQILATLMSEGIRAGGVHVMVNRATLRTSANMMQDMWLRGWVGGCGSPDARGDGNTPQSSWWWLTSRGEAIARAAAATGEGA